MNAIIVHHPYKMTDKYTDRLMPVPLLINVETINSIEPIYDPGSGVKALIIAAGKKYEVRESYKDIVSVIKSNTNLNFVQNVETSVSHKTSHLPY